MILEFDRDPELTIDEKIESLMESVQMALLSATGIAEQSEIKAEQARGSLKIAENKSAQASVAASEAITEAARATEIANQAGVTIGIAETKGDTVNNYAVVIRNSAGENITPTYPEWAFQWILETEDGEELVGSGYDTEVTLSECGYNACIVLDYTLVQKKYLKDSNLVNLYDRDEKALFIWEEV